MQPWTACSEHCNFFKVNILASYIFPRCRKPFTATMFGLRCVSHVFNIILLSATISDGLNGRPHRPASLFNSRFQIIIRICNCNFILLICVIKIYLGFTQLCQRHQVSCTTNSSPENSPVISIHMWLNNVWRSFKPEHSYTYKRWI